MIKDAIIETARGRIVFSCPHCLAGGVFPPETVAGISGSNTAIKCPRCDYMVAINKPKIEAAVAGLVSRDPFLKNPLTEQRTTVPPGATESPGTAKPPGTPEPPPARETPRPPAGDAPAAPSAPEPPALAPAESSGAPVRFEKLESDYVILQVHGLRGTPMPSGLGLTDLILVVDKEDSFRDDIWIVFSDIARVEGYRGARGAADYIKKRKNEVTIMMMDTDLGDGSCFEVLDALRDGSRAEKIPAIVAYGNKDEYEIIKRGVGSYRQVKAVVHKEELIKKMIELSIKIVKKGG